MTPVMQIPELVLIEAQQLQNRRMKISHVITIANRTQTKLIGLTKRLAALHTATRKPHRIPVHIVIAPIPTL